MSANPGNFIKALKTIKKILKKTKVDPIDELDYVPFYVSGAVLGGGSVEMAPVTDEDGSTRYEVSKVTVDDPIPADTAKELIDYFKHATTEHKDAQLRHTSGQVAVAIIGSLASSAVTALIFYWLITLGEKGLGLFI